MAEPASDKQIDYIERFCNDERPAPKGWREHYESIIAKGQGKEVNRKADVPVRDIAALVARIREQDATIKRLVLERDTAFAGQDRLKSVGSQRIRNEIAHATAKLERQLAERDATIKAMNESLSRW